MTAILAFCEFRFQDWLVLGHCRDTAEENYLAAAAFHAKPLYRVVFTLKHRLWLELIEKEAA